LTTGRWSTRNDTEPAGVSIVARNGTEGQA
jgi:hypothetical protein